MAELGFHEPIHVVGPIPPLSNQPSTTETSDSAKASRRVAFSELPLKQKKKKTTKRVFQDDDEEAAERRGRDSSHPSCCMCCAWACMIVFGVSLVLLIIGVIFFAFLHSGLPKVSVQSMSIPRLNITSKKASSSAAASALLTADVDLVIDVSNNNQKTGLSYSTMYVNVWSEKISLGRTKVAAFHQEPKKDGDGNNNNQNSVKELKVRTSVSKSPIDKDDGEFLKENYKNKEMVLDVVMYGTLGYNIGGSLKLNGFPVMITCLTIDQTVMDYGATRKCSVKFMASRRLVNGVGGGS